MESGHEICVSVHKWIGRSQAFFLLEPTTQQKTRRNFIITDRKTEISFGFRASKTPPWVPISTIKTLKYGKILEFVALGFVIGLFSGRNRDNHPEIPTLTTQPQWSSLGLVIPPHEAF